MCLCVYMCVVPPILVFVVGWSCCVCGVNKKTNSDTWLGFPGKKTQFFYFLVGVVVFAV